MAVTVHFSGHLKSFTDGSLQTRLDDEFASVGSALDALWKKHPALHDRVLDEQGRIRQHVNIFVGDRNVKRLDGLDTPVNGSEIHIFNAVSGG